MSNLDTFTSCWGLELMSQDIVDILSSTNYIRYCLTEYNRSWRTEKYGYNSAMRIVDILSWEQDNE